MDTAPHLFRYSSIRRTRLILGGIFLAGALSSIAPSRASELPVGITEEKLAAPSGPRGATLFAQLSADKTGVVTENRYADPKMWWELFQEFTVGAIGTGVAVGDYDGDGRPDIFVVSKTESCRLFRNLGDWKFEDVTDKAGVGDKGDAARVWKQGATFVDVNNDGYLDIYLCRFGSPNRLYINQTNGTFKEEAATRGLAVSDGCGMAAFADYDRDGWLDVYIQTNLLDSAAHPNGQRDYLFHNNGNGTFTDVSTQAGITGETQGHSATWWDYDNDGWPDLYVANDFSLADVLYHNNHNGTFTNTLSMVVPHTSFSSMGADLGDVNNDGLIDLLVADMAASSHEKDQRGMASSRAIGTELPDGSKGVPQYLINALFLNTGTGRVLEAANLAGLAATDWTWSVRLEDLDNDGRLDLHVTNGMVRELHNTDLLARMMVAESPAERVKIMQSSPVLAEKNLAFKNKGELIFENVSRDWGLDRNGVSFGAAFGDFDGDGDLDLVQSNYQSGVSLLRNDSGDGHRIMISLRGVASNRFGVGAIAQIETVSGVQVRQLVLARGYLSSSEPVLHFGLGTDERILRLAISWPSGAQQIFTDLPVDRKFTITESSPSPKNFQLSDHPKTNFQAQFTEVSRALNLSLQVQETEVQETSLQPLLPFRHNREGPSLAVGDINGDGKDDVFLGGTAIDAARIAAGGVNNFQPAVQLPASPAVNDGPLLIFDVNGDGLNDLLVTKAGAALPAGAAEYQPMLWLGDGHGGFQPAPSDALPALHSSIGAVGAADFDHSGSLDLFIGGRLIPGQYPLAPISSLLVNRGGKFIDVTDTMAPELRRIGMVTSVLWTDVDSDGWIDLLLALEWGSVKYFRNHQGQSFEDKTEFAGFGSGGVGWWTSLAAADFNGDGRLDYVAGNLGLNTQYQATPRHPAILFQSDFKDGGVPQIIEAYYESDRLVPWRAYKQLSAAVPSIRKRFPKVNDFARSTLNDLVGEPRLTSALRFAATEFRSGVFLSQSDGRYAFAALPRLAQISPLQGIVAGDFDGDGKADIYAVQNSYAPVAAIGRFDGGLSQFLRGEGNGGFTAVSPAGSGLIVPGDAKALAVIDFDLNGWPDFLVSRNSDLSLAFQNQGRTRHNSFAVVLRGGLSNQTAVGAQITVYFSNGTNQMSEIHAGSGHRSQSSARSFFGYPDSVVPKQIRVLWPSGERTKTEISVPSATITLTAPSSVTH